MLRTSGLPPVLGAAGFLLGMAVAASAQESALPVAPGGFAVVSANGKLGSNMNVTKVNRLSPGHYQLKFNQNVSECATTATIAGNTKTTIPGYVIVNRYANVVGVQTFAAATLLPADYKFDLNVTCAPA